MLSDTEDSESELDTNEKFQLMLELHYKQKLKWKNRLKKLSKIRRYQYISAGLVLPNDRYPEIRKRIETEKKKKNTKLNTKKLKEDTKSNLIARKVRERERERQHKRKISYSN